MPGGNRFVFKSKETLDGLMNQQSLLGKISSVYFAVTTKRLQGEFSYNCFQNLATENYLWIPSLSQLSESVFTT